MSEFSRYLVALGGGNEIGAGSYLLEVDGKRILVDAGMRLKGDRHFPDYEYISQVGMVGLNQCDAVFLTHAHMDHSGSLPAVYHKTRSPLRDVPIYATLPTRAIAEILLKDTIKIKSRHGEFVGDLDVQEFEKGIAEDTLAAIRLVEFGQPFMAAPGIQATYYPAGHILGAGMVLIEIGDFRVLFSGDFSGVGQVTVGGYSLPKNLPQVDLLVCETTYAYKGKEKINIPAQQQSLLSQLTETIQRKGKVLIPAFAVGRAQEILRLLHEAMRAEKIPTFPVWSDGMVNQVCGVYNMHRNFLKPGLDDVSEDLFFDHELGIQPSPMRLMHPSFPDQLKDAPPCCIVASSGMLVNGSCSAKYAETLIEDPKNSILFTGYLDEESPGSQLTRLSDRSRTFRINQKDLQVKADIQPYHLSAHASLPQITELVERVRPNHVAFIHGYPGFESDRNLYESFYEWGRMGILPAFARNNTPLFF